MAAALEFAGNDVKVELGEDGHSNRHGASILPDTLRWLWRGYPQPITVGEPPPGAGRGLFAQLVPRRELVPPPPPPTPPPAPAAGRGSGPRGAVYALIYRDKLWEQVGDAYQSAVSPAVDKDGNVFFADPAASRIYKSDAARVVTVFKEYTGGARALRVGADGRLYASQPAARRLVSYGPAGDEKVVAQNIQADDLVLTRSGAIYVVDTTHKTVVHIGEKGQQRVVYASGASAEIMRPTALTLTPDQAMLLVGDFMDRYQWSFQIAPDGSLVNGEPFQRLEMPEEGLFSGVRGLTVDSLGYMWAATAMGIQVCEQPGRCSNILNTPEFTTSPVTSLAFGGPGRAWLYVTQGGKLFRRETRRTGVVAWEPVKPPQPGL
jgi:sugar lactone lactonase YvrE